MQSSLNIQILAVLLLSWANLHPVCGQTENFQLNLGEINTAEVQLHPLGDNQYDFKITEPLSEREEIISLEPSDDVAAGPVVVTRGQIETNFPNENLNMVVNYVADRNGYRASYRIGQGINADLGISFGSRLNIKDLKSLTG